jgi:hypothetical protein
VPEICDGLHALGRIRRFCIKSQSRCDRSIESYLAGLLGFRVTLPEAERKKLFLLAAKVRKAIEKGGLDWSDPGYGDAFRAVVPTVLASQQSRKVWDDLREATEKNMKSLAVKLPVWAAFAKEIRGFGELGLAVIIAETTTPEGNLSNYSSVGKLWKRLGLAVIDGRRQGNPGKDATDNDWITHGYNRQRRAEMWAFFSDILFRAQWAADKDEDGKNPKDSGKPVAIAAHPLGRYGEVYAERKAWMLARDLTLGHAHNDARRYMTKRLLKHLWQAWRGLERED